MSEVKSLSSIQVACVCVLSALVEQWVNKGIASLTINSTYVKEDKTGAREYIYLNIRVRIASSTFKGEIFLKPGKQNNKWVLVDMKSNLKFVSGYQGIRFGYNEIEEKFVIEEIS